jgi:hypothetical protein
MFFLDHKRLLHHIDEHRSTYLERWEQFHTRFSEQQQRQIAQAAIGSDTDDWLLHQLQRRGIHTTLLNNDSSFIYGELDSRAPHTLLFYHQYTANFPDVWELLPIAIWLMMLDIYQECNNTVPVNIKWLLHRSGKSDASTFHSIVEEHHQQLQADGCLWSRRLTAEESQLFPITNDIPLLFLGIKGLLCIELAAHMTAHPLPSHYGSIVPNAAWRLLWALNSLKDTREEILIESFYDSLTPIEDEALSSLYTLPDVAPALARQWGMKDLLLGLQGFQMRYAHLLTPTCTINLLTGGDATSPTTASTFPSQIPSHARAQVDFHLMPGQEPDKIFADLQSHLHNQGFSDIQTRLLYRCPPAYTSPTNAFVQLVRKATTRAYRHELLILPISPESHPLSLLQHITGMPILITLSGAQHTPQNWDHQSVTSSLIRGLKQAVLMIHAPGNA